MSVCVYGRILFYTCDAWSVQHSYPPSSGQLFPTIRQMDHAQLPELRLVMPSQKLHEGWCRSIEGPTRLPRRTNYDESQRMWFLEWYVPFIICSVFCSPHEGTDKDLIRHVGLFWPYLETLFIPLFDYSKYWEMFPYNKNRCLSKFAM